jgi:hypothetical protein
MSWVLAAIAAWLLPGVLVLCFAFVVTMRKQCSDLLIALRRRQAPRGRKDQRGASDSTA